MIVCLETPNANYNRRREGLPFIIFHVVSGSQVSTTTGKKREKLRKLNMVGVQRILKEKTLKTTILVGFN